MVQELYVHNRVYVCGLSECDTNATPPSRTPPSRTPPSRTPKIKTAHRGQNGKDPEFRGLVRLLVALRDRDDGVGAAELLQQLGLKDHKDLRVRFLFPAMSRQWIEYTVPDKPRSRLQRYRLTPEGRAAILPEKDSQLRQDSRKQGDTSKVQPAAGQIVQS